MTLLQLFKCTGNNKKIIGNDELNKGKGSMDYVREYLINFLDY